MKKQIVILLLILIMTISAIGWFLVVYGANEKNNASVNIFFNPVFRDLAARSLYIFSPSSSISTALLIISITQSPFSGLPTAKPVSQKSLIVITLNLS